MIACPFVLPVLISTFALAPTEQPCAAIPQAALIPTDNFLLSDCSLSVRWVLPALMFTLPFALMVRSVVSLLVSTLLNVASPLRAVKVNFPFNMFLLSETSWDSLYFWEYPICALTEPPTKSPVTKLTTSLAYCNAAVASCLTPFLLSRTCFAILAAASSAEECPSAVIPNVNFDDSEVLSISFFCLVDKILSADNLKPCFSSLTAISFCASKKLSSFSAIRLAISSSDNCLNAGLSFLG